MNPGSRTPVAVLVACCVVFGVLILLLVKQNRELKADISLLQSRLNDATINKGEKTGYGPSLQVGESVSGLQLVRPDRSATPLAFPHDGPTMLFMLGRHCGYCEQAVPIYDDILREHVAGIAPTKLRVVGVIADAPPPDDRSEKGNAAWADAFTKAGKFIPPFAVPDGAKTWLLKVNSTPAAVLLDGQGKVLGMWRGEVTKERADEMRAALVEALAVK
ncbi:MAG: thioredoxin family protein [Phycisphaerales bacterium]|nr:thioredoxin family protein [Phycisphaerales bacterium]